MKSSFCVFESPGLSVAGRRRLPPSGVSCLASSSTVSWLEDMGLRMQDVLFLAKDISENRKPKSQTLVVPFDNKIATMASRTQTSRLWSARCRSLTGAVSPSLAILSLQGAAARSLHEGPDTVDELLDRHLVKKKKKNEEQHKRSDEEQDHLLERRLTSIRRESLCLYRDIIRATRFFSWPDARGVVWRDVLRSNARREFEEARLERDPEIITRLLIGGRDAVQSALHKLAEAQRKKIAEQEEEKIRGGR